MPAPTKPQKSPDKNVEKVVDLMRSRSVFGLKKYKVTTERTDLTPLEWVRHWQAENADATIYAEKLAQEIETLTAAKDRLEAQLAARNEELEVLRKAVTDAGRFLLIGANRYADGNDTETRAAMTMAASALGVELQWPKSAKQADTDKAFVEAFNAGRDAKHAKLKSAAESELPKPQKLTACEQVRLERNEQWKNAVTNPPKVRHAVLGLVNGTTKIRAVYYEPITGKWVDVNDRPVTVSQWRHL